MPKVQHQWYYRDVSELRQKCPEFNDCMIEIDNAMRDMHISGLTTDQIYWKACGMLRGLAACGVISDCQSAEIRVPVLNYIRKVFSEND